MYRNALMYLSLLSLMACDTHEHCHPLPLPELGSGFLDAGVPDEQPPDARPAPDAAPVPDLESCAAVLDFMAGDAAEYSGLFFEILPERVRLSSGAEIAIAEHFGASVHGAGWSDAHIDGPEELVIDFLIPGGVTNVYYSMENATDNDAGGLAGVHELQAFPIGGGPWASLIDARGTDGYGFVDIGAKFPQLVGAQIARVVIKAHGDGFALGYLGWTARRCDP